MPKGHDKNPKPKHENSKAAIRPHQFKPGQSGNPSGKPKHRPMTEAYIRLANKVVNCNLPFEQAIAELKKLQKGATGADLAAIGQLIAAANGKSPAATEMREAIEGRAPQRIELSGSTEANAAPIEIETRRRVDVSKLSTAQLLAYEEILKASS